MGRGTTAGIWCVPVFACVAALLVVWAPSGRSQGTDELDVLIRELQRYPVVTRVTAEASSGTISVSVTDRLLREMKRAAARLEKQYGLRVDPMRYDIMDLLDIEARMKMRHPSDSIEVLLGGLLNDEDLERNRGLFGLGNM